MKAPSTDSSFMKPANHFALSVLTGGPLTLAGLGGRYLGLAPLIGMILAGLGILILAEGSHCLHYAKSRGPDTHGTVMPSDAGLRARIRLFWFLAFGLVLGCVLLIPVLPYLLGDSSSQLIYAVIAAQVIVAVASLLYLRRKLFSGSMGTGSSLAARR